MPRKSRMIGRRFNRLVVSKLDHIKGSQYYFLCLCDCGGSKIVGHSSLLNKYVQSCGCLRPGCTGLAAQKYGQEYNTWQAMKCRCNRVKDKRYQSYGGRGIKVCSEWSENYAAFSAWARKNGYKPGLTIDRINPDGDYEPDNCQWITRAENTAKRWRDNGGRANV